MTTAEEELVEHVVALREGGMSERNMIQQRREHTLESPGAGALMSLDVDEDGSPGMGKWA